MSRMSVDSNYFEALASGAVTITFGLCHETRICQHEVRVTYADGTERSTSLRLPNIKKFKAHVPDSLIAEWPHNV